MFGYNILVGISTYGFNNNLNEYLIYHGGLGSQEIVHFDCQSLEH